MKKILYICTLYSSALLQFLLLPIFVSFVGKESFGEYVYYYTVINWLTFSSTLGTQTKVRQLFPLRSFEGLKVTLIIAFGFTILTLMFSFLFFYFFSGYSIELIVTILMLTVAIGYLSIVNAFLIADDKAITSAVNQCLFSVFPLVIFLLFSINEDVTYTVRFYLMIVLALIIIYMNKGYFGVAFYESKVRSNELLCSTKDNIKIGMNSLFDKVISQGDKIFVGWAFGFEILAIYAIGSQISNLLQVTFKAFLIFIEQKIFKKTNGLFRELLFLLLGGAVISVLAYLFISEMFLYFFDEDYLYVLSLLPFQFLIVYLRSISGVQFTADLVRGAHTRNVIVQYSFLLFISSIICLNYQSLDILQFVQMIAIMSFLSNLINFTYRVINK